jgi:hypothetical protein
MRYLYTLLLSIGCFAVVLQAQAAGIPVKRTSTPTEYQAAAQGMPADALNNYHQLTAAAAVATHHSFSKENAVYFTFYNYNNRAVYILNDCFKNTTAVFNGYYAIIFRFKLIFPQHYHW